MKKLIHSVTLEKDYCNGCTYCIDRCPTQAIRVKDGKAEIITERCIDCGVCINVCPYHAKGAQSDGLEMLEKFKFNIALPGISTYGQFGLNYDMEKVFNSFYQLGFDYVYDVAYAADLLTIYQLKKVKEEKENKPLISTFCPAVIRLIQIRYPSLINNIIKVESPMEVASRLARKKIMETTELKSEEIGVFYITQCPARITSIRNPIGINKSDIDGAIAIDSIFSKILREYEDVPTKAEVQKSTGKGIGWGRVGGQSFAMQIDNYLAVDGVEEVIKVLDQVELGKLDHLDFIEAYACVTGCVGGPLNVVNPFIAKSVIRKRTQIYSQADFDEIDRHYNSIPEEAFEWNEEIEPNPVMKLDTDFKCAIEKMSKIEEIYQTLPGIDCGACGSPTCRAFAEDIVLGRTDKECIVRKHIKKDGGNKNESK